MIFKKEIEKQIFSLIFLSVSGWLIHLSRHPISDEPSNLVPFIFGILAIFFVPMLLNYKKTYLIGYLINGFSVIIGTVVMATLSISHLSVPVSVSDILFRTLLGSILILMPKLFIGQMILRHYHPTGLGRMFTAWWWMRHFVYFSIVFSIGHWLWR
jgi:hypothetical protein